MAALNITNDMLQRNAESTASDRYIEDASSRLHDKLDTALAQFKLEGEEPAEALNES